MKFVVVQIVARLLIIDNFSGLSYRGYISGDDEIKTNVVKLIFKTYSGSLV